ncbi:hypothetical protein [Pseudooceanicola onchidii]|uniref:hypothetical protein n=1 Tax=Pseudooceanicola onchidii TaxID=2562279 RepID=UPI00145C0159|nr:hypothetical protein [Pseudooceanicola onchidii]
MIRHPGLPWLTILRVVMTGQAAAHAAPEPSVALPVGAASVGVCAARGLPGWA